MIYYLTSPLELPSAFRSSPSVLMATEDIEMSLLNLPGSQGSDPDGEGSGGESDLDSSRNRSEKGEDRHVTIYIHRSISPLTLKLNIKRTCYHFNLC